VNEIDDSKGMSVDDVTDLLAHALRKKRRKMIDLQHYQNNCTTPPHIEWGPVCRAHPHVKRCCAVVVVVLCKNQIPKEKQQRYQIF
jgi:hypothetical protein